MKRKLLSLAESAVLVLALLVPAAAVGAPPSPKPQPKPAAALPPHPEIRDAITALQAARQHLNEASHDFGGHRADAVRAINEALKQLQICMRYDR
jgi:hypothetical protein